MFEGFSTERIIVDDAEINLLTGGGGPPVLLLHGYPQTHVIWHKVAPLLTSKFTLVIPDLPGYGASKGPAPDPANQNYSKRNIARLLAALMSLLGHDKFAVAGHDRGGRVGFRLALDYPDRVVGFAALDIVPTLLRLGNDGLAACARRLPLALLGPTGRRSRTPDRMRP
jgi:haloacetate dehalogenase